MRFLVAWDGSEIGTLALRATLRTLARADDELVVYHVTNRGRYSDAGEFELEALQRRLADELACAADGLRVLAQRTGSTSGNCELEECASPNRSVVANSSEVGQAEVVLAAAPALAPALTVHEKEAAAGKKVSLRILEFAALCAADVLVMGSTGVKAAASATYQRTTLGSSAHLAAFQAPCSVVLIRPGYRVDTKLATVYMVAVDGSEHSYNALQLAAEMAKSDKDEIVCRVVGAPQFIEPIEEACTSWLQRNMQRKRVEYAVITTELDESADVHGEDLADTASECRFRQQAFLVFGARGRGSEMPDSPCASPSGSDDAPTTLGKVARWCVREAQCSLIIARQLGRMSAPSRTRSI